MISRRIIRVKVMQTLYAFRNSSGQSLNLAEKELNFSIGKTYDLYHWLLLLINEVHTFAENRLEQNKLKQLPTQEDLNPNTKFINNQIILKLQENEALAKYTENNKLGWVLFPKFIKELYTKLVESEYYQEYMKDENTSLKQDRKLVEFFYTDIVAPNEELYSLLEEQSIYWNDDVEFVLGMIIKTVSKFKLSTLPSKSLLPLYKDEEDREYTKKLFRKSILEYDTHKEIIEKHLHNWDLDRVAFIDILLIELAICEFLYFPSIPTKVTLNEYIDLAKFYSSKKSRTFINGILDKILKSLEQEEKIVKVGRGLINK